MSIHESGEMYLETILILSKSNGQVRSVDISEYMNFSKPSVSRAMGILVKQNNIVIDSKGYITLTEKGKEIATKIYERHILIKNVLLKLGVSENTAEEDACKIEHIISDETFEALKKLLD